MFTRYTANLLREMISIKRVKEKAMRKRKKVMEIRKKMVRRRRKMTIEKKQGGCEKKHPGISPFKRRRTPRVDVVGGLESNSVPPNLLASGADDGEICIWDSAKPSEPSQFPLLKMMVASDDDRSPTLELWDMRNTMQHVGEFSGYQKGVIAMEWCPSGSSYLLTCAKDKRTTCWYTNTAEVYLLSLVSEQSMVSELEAAIENGDMTSLRELC